MSSRLIALIGALLCLAACSRPAEVKPALWQVEGPHGERAYLFGTIHSLPEPVEWKSAKVAAAMKGSDLLVMEIARILDNERTAETFANLAQSPNLPRLADRVPPDLRDELEHEMGLSGYRMGELDHYETWAAMLMFQQAESSRSKSESKNGIDRAIAKDWNGAVDEFEGARVQLSIFDQLPEDAQRAMLAETLRDADKQPEKIAKLQQAWAQGNLDYIADATYQDFAGQPVLRAALLTNRNQEWLTKLGVLMAAGKKPFVAVGAAHLAGPDGLPALLEARGFKVTRLQ